MKHLFTISLCLLLGWAANGQFIQKVNYRGAFAPAPTPMWIDNWTNFDPQNTVYPAPTVSVPAGTITSNTTWTAGNVYQLMGYVYVDTLVTLTIEPGTVIRGNVGVNSALIVKRGGKLMAEATANNPIVFTSGQGIGDRTRGDWGGVILLGRSTCNATSTLGYGLNFIEGLPPGSNQTYGGGANPVLDDNSGVLKYVRIEYGGIVFSTNNEINGLTMGAVGSGTTIDYVQVTDTNDDSFEWFGGTVNCSHLVAFGGTDDNWDTDFGWSGEVQFCLGIRKPNASDNASGQSTEGFESDNGPSQSTANPRTDGIFSNVTEIGPLRGSTANVIPLPNTFNRALRLRNNTELKVFNSIFLGWPFGVMVDGTPAETNAINNLLRFKSNIVAGSRTGQVTARASGSSFNIWNFFGTNANDSLVGETSARGILINPFEDTYASAAAIVYTGRDFRPVPSVALEGFEFLDPSIPSFIQPVSYRGAFAPAPTPMWTDTWTNFDPQNTVYPAPTVLVPAGTITSNTTWTAGNVYQLLGYVYVDTLVTLTIEPGTVIRGNVGINSALIVKRGGKLMAEATANNPIVFTSGQGIGDRTRGDWGGVILLGRSTCNATSTLGYGLNFIEGLPPGSNQTYGGGANPVLDDNSGVLKYVRIEYGGIVFSTNNEINGLTMGAVGSGTKIDYVQVTDTNDDSFEWFGGTVNCSHLVAFGGTDDNWDTDFGFSGAVQFCLGIRKPNASDNASGQSTEGFESDNGPSQSTANPRTNGVFSNVTEIGPLRGSTANVIPLPNTFNRALRLRNNTELKVFNSLFMSWPFGVMVDGTPAENNATNNLLKFKNNVVAGSRAGQVTARASGSSFNIWNFFGTNDNDSLVGETSARGILINPFEDTYASAAAIVYTGRDFRPVPSPALQNTNFTEEALPVTFTKFEGETVKNVHNLSWETSTEVDSRGFDLERSADGRNFSAIAFVATKAINGNSNSALSYSYQDNKPLAGISYYRLKQIDINGRSAYSKVLMLQTLVGNDLQFSLVYPNPVKSQLSMVVMAPNANRISVQIVDVAGRTISAQNFNVVRGSNQLQINVGTLSRGQYFIKATDANLKSANTQAFMKD